MKKKYYYVFASFLALLVTTSVIAQQQTNYYVSKSTGNDSNSGLSWNQAFSSVNKVLDLIEDMTDNGEIYNIYIAQGDYTPSNHTFSGNKHIKFYGGYPIPGADTPDDYVCVQTPTLFPVKFQHPGSRNLFTINNTTSLSFNGITYKHTGGNNRFIYVSRGANKVNITLENMIIPSYQADDAFIYFYHTVNSSFTANNIYVSGAAGNRRFLYIENGSGSNNINVSVNNSTFKDNTNGSNHPLFDLYFQNIDRNGKATFTGNTFFGNGNRSTNGSCIKVDHGEKIIIEDNTISGNKCRIASIYIKDSNILDVKNSSFCSNEGDYGSAILVDDVTSHISRNNYFKSNTATAPNTEIKKGGGAIHSNSPITSTKDQFYNNSSKSKGGAIMFDLDHPRSFNQCVFQENIGYEGGGIYIYNTDKNTLSVKNSFFIKNTETSTLYLYGGGAIYLNRSNYSSENNLYRGNESPDSQGGAIMLRHGNVNITIKNDTFIGNISKKCGGCIFAEDANTLKVDGTTFMDNESREDHGGGAIYVFNMDKLILGKTSPNIFIRNYAENNGGAVHCKGNGNIEDNGSIYYANHAGSSGEGGGAVYTDAGGTFTNCSFLKNYTSSKAKGGAIYAKKHVTFIDSKSFGNSINQTNYTTPNLSEFHMTGNNKMTIYGASKVQLRPNTANYRPANYILHPGITQSTSFSPPSDVIANSVPAINGQCPIAPTIEETLKLSAFITTSKGTMSEPDINSNYCWSEKNDAYVTLYPVTGKPSFTFEYRIVTIDAKTQKETIGSVHFITTNGNESINLALPSNVPTEGMTYRYEILSVEDAEGNRVEYRCNPPLSATINILPKAPLTISVTPAKICLGKNFQLMANYNQVGSTTVTSWNWSGPNGFTSSEQNPTIRDATPNMSGEYILTITDNNGCTAKETIDVTVNKCKALWLGKTDTDWGKEENWKDGYVPLEGDDIIFATAKNNNNQPAKNDLYVPGTSTKPTIIGNLINESNKALVVPAGKAITINKKVIGSDSAEKANKIQIKAAKDKANGTLYAPNMCGTPLFGTVELYAKGFREGHKEGEIISWQDNIQGSPTNGQTFEASYHWQYFGVPVETVKANPTFYKAYLREYHEYSNGDNTKFYQKWKDLDNASTLKAFFGYEITQEKPTTYQIVGKLQTCPQILTLTRKASEVKGGIRYGLGQNIFGNSYTTAIKVHEIEFPKEVEPTVYLYNTGSFVSWGNQTGTQINQGAQMAGQYTSIPKETGSVVYDGQIPSMNGFLLKFTDGQTIPGGNVKVTLKYNKVAVNNTQPQTAPKAPLSYLEIELASKSTVDRLWLFSQEGTTEGFDNGWDGRKFFGTPTAFIYSETPAGNMQVNTTETLENKVITFYANGDKEYTLFINKKGLENYANLTLLDLETKKVIALKDEQTVYHFTTKTPNQASKRFKIVNSRNITDEMLHDVDGNIEIQLFSNKVSVTNYTQQTGIIQVFDISGKLVMSKAMSVGVNEYELHLDRGAYIVTGSTETSNGKKRIIVK